MGLHDVAEQLDACRADTVTLEQERDAALAKLAAIAALCDACTPPLGMELRPDGNEDPEAAAYVQGVGEVITAVRRALGEQPAGVLLTPDEIDVVAPTLLEAGTRHLEHPGTAWHQLGAHLHRIAERLYAATNRMKEHQ